MIILGVDPGTLVTGYGVIETAKAGLGVAKSSKSGKKAAYAVIEYGTIESKRATTLPVRLGQIFTKLSEVFERTTPDEFAIESAFYHKNIQSTLKLGHARGVAIVCAVLRQVPTGEYSPREIKRAVVGNGNASKEQVEFMVRQLLALDPDDKQLADAYDALAVAITHAEQLRAGAFVPKSSIKKKSSKNNWKQFVSENPERIR